MRTCLESGADVNYNKVIIQFCVDKLAFDDRECFTLKMSSQEPPMKAYMFEVKHHISFFDQNLHEQERVS